jgi:hypothetical protein
MAALINRIGRFREPHYLCKAQRDTDAAQAPMSPRKAGTYITPLSIKSTFAGRYGKLSITAIYGQMMG